MVTGVFDIVAEAVDGTTACAYGGEERRSEDEENEVLS